MQKRAEIALAFTTIALFGGLSIFTLPLRAGNEMPESGLTTEACTLDAAIAEREEIIIQNKAYLDGLLEQAAIEAQTLEVVMEAREIVTETGEIATETATETPETETVEESITETEIAVLEENTQAVFTPCDSMMAADLQAWVYAYSMQMAIDPYIVIAICERESCCISNIMGDNGRAFGIMQIHTVWVRDKMAAHGYTDADMLQAIPNITIGVEILKDYLNTGNGLEWALMAYNGGADMAGNATTREYAAWVIARAEELKRR